MVKIVVASKPAASEPKSQDNVRSDADGPASMACISSYILPPVGLPNLGNTCFMNSGMQVVWRAFLDHFLLSITLTAKLPKATSAGCAPTAPSFVPADSSSSSANTTAPSIGHLMNTRIAALREHLSTLATSQGVPLGAIIAKAVLKHIKQLQGGARRPMEGGGAEGGEGDIEGGPPGLLAVLGELFLRDAATSIMSGAATSGKKSKKSSGSSARVSAIKDVLASENERFVDWDQHDSHELVMCLLSAVSSRYNTGSGVTSTSYEAIDERKKGEGEEEAARRWWRKVCAKDDSFVGKMFRCLTRTKTVCGKCGKVSLNFDPIMEVQVSLSQASLEKANARRRERIESAMGMSTNGAKPTALHRMAEEVEALRSGSSSNVIIETAPPAATTDVDADDDKENTEGARGERDVESDAESNAEAEDEPEEEVSASTSCLSKKDLRALKKVEKARVKHERDLKKLKRDTTKPTGKGKAKKGTNIPNKKGGGSYSSSAGRDDDDDDDLVCLEDLLYTQLASSTEVEGFKCEGCGAVSASSPASPPPSKGYPGTTPPTTKKGGGKHSGAGASKNSKRSANAINDNEGAAASSSAPAAASSGTTTVITHDHTHYPPFMLVHLLRFGYEGDKIRVPVKLSTTSEHVLDSSTCTIRPSTSALLALPPRPSTSQLDDHHLYASTTSLEEDIGSDYGDDGVATHIHGSLHGLESLYEVVGVVRHHGRTLTYGHYTSSVKSLDFFDRPMSCSQVPNSPEAVNEPSQWYLCDDTQIDGEKVGRVGSSACWKGGDRDAYMVLLRSVKYTQRTPPTTSHQADDDAEDEEGGSSSPNCKDGDAEAKALPSSHL